MRQIVRYACALIALALLTAAPSGASSVEALSLAPSKTWVGIARVHLEVDRLQMTADGLAGDYRIRVPMKPSENDTGRILLAVDSIDQLQETGRQLLGQAHSKFGKVHDLSCRVLENGRIVVEVISDERTLSFRTRMRSAD